MLVALVDEGGERIAQGDEILELRLYGFQSLDSQGARRSAGPLSIEPGQLADIPHLRRQRGIFWLVGAGLVALIAFPWFARYLF